RHLGGLRRHERGELPRRPVAGGDGRPHDGDRRGHPHGKRAGHDGNAGVTTSVLVHRALDEAAGRWPDRPAVRWRDESWSYARLARSAAGLATALREAGLGPGDRCATHLPKLPEALAAVYGGLRAGAAFVPLDPLAPASYVRSLAERAGIRALVTGAGLETSWRAWLESHPLALTVAVAEPEE